LPPASAGGQVGFPPFIEARFSAASLESLHARSSEESPAEAGFEKKKESETPRLKAGAKKNPLKRAEAPFQHNDFWILLDFVLFRPPL